MQRGGKRLARGAGWAVECCLIAWLDQSAVDPRQGNEVNPRLDRCSCTYRIHWEYGGSGVGHDIRALEACGRLLSTRLRGDGRLGSRARGNGVGAGR